MDRRKRWRIAWIFGPVVILSCCLLVIDAMRALLADIHHAVFRVVEMLIEWASPTIVRDDAHNKSGGRLR